LRAVSLELRQIGPEIADLLLVLEAGEHHLGARHFGLRVLDVFLECRGIPGDRGVLVGIAVAEIRHRAGLAPVEAVELGPDLVARVLADVMAGPADAEGLFAGGDILRLSYAHRGANGHSREYQYFHLFSSLKRPLPFSARIGREYNHLEQNARGPMSVLMP